MSSWLPLGELDWLRGFSIVNDDRRDGSVEAVTLVKASKITT